MSQSGDVDVYAHAPSDAFAERLDGARPSRPTLYRSSTTGRTILEALIDAGQLLGCREHDDRPRAHRVPYGGDEVIVALDQRQAARAWLHDEI